MKTFNKKLMALVAIFAVIVTMLVPTGFVKAVTSPKLSISTVKAVKNQEETVTVKLTLENNTEGLRVLAGRIKYDQDKLEYVSDEIKGLTNADSRRVTKHNEEKGTVTLNASCSGLETAAIDDNGVILEITFKVKADVSGNAEITLAMDDVVGNDGTALEFTEENGKIEINIPTTGVNLNKTSLNLVAGGTEKLTATVIPEDATNKDLVWTSSNEEVATVSEDGTVTAVAAGNATITVKTVDGNYTKTCEVTVTCAHTNTKTHEAVASTCQTQGHAEYVTCEDCGKIISGSDEKLSLADHNYGTIIEQVDPVHTENELKPGKKAHYKCSVCNKLFDENKNETTDKQLEIKAPTHEYGEEWEKATTYHYKECGCGNMIKEEHKGGEATCTNKAICEVCGEEYGELNPENHKNTEVKDAKEATCTEEGYTGDTYCKDCNQKVKAGEKLAATGHKGGEATCTNKAICEVCGEEYGELNPENHKNIEIKDAKEATTEAEGYTGDIYCKDCGALVRKGEVIAKIEEPQPEEPKDDGTKVEDNNKEEVVEKDPSKPQTDDNSQMMLYASLLVVSGISFVVIAKCKTKRKISKHSK